KTSSGFRKQFRRSCYEWTLSRTDRLRRLRKGSKNEQYVSSSSAPKGDETGGDEQGRKLNQKLWSLFMSLVAAGDAVRDAITSDHRDPSDHPPSGDHATFDWREASSVS